jgi:glycosyltransferase involved in cell wall biosynthesis
VLVPPDHPAALATALARLIADPAARARLGAAGNDRVRTAFSFAHGIDQLLARLATVGIRPDAIEPRATTPCASSSTRR